MGYLIWEPHHPQNVLQQTNKNIKIAMQQRKRCQHQEMRSYRSGKRHKATTSNSISFTSDTLMVMDDDDDDADELH